MAAGKTPPAPPDIPGGPLLAAEDWIRAHVDVLPAEARTAFAREFAALRVTTAAWDARWHEWFHGKAVR